MAATRAHRHLTAPRRALARRVYLEACAAEEVAPEPTPAQEAAELLELAAAGDVEEVP